MATTGHKKVSTQTAVNAVVVGLSATFLLWVLALMGQDYATASHTLELQTNLARCQNLDGAAETIPFPPHPETTIVNMIKAARETCYKTLIARADFEGLKSIGGKDKKVEVTGISQFLFATESPGHFLYTALLAFMYTTLTICGAILFIRFIESRRLTNAAIGEVIDQFKKWFEPADTSSKSAPSTDATAPTSSGQSPGLVNVAKISSNLSSTLGNVLAPIVISTPAVLGISMASKAPPPSFEPVPQTKPVEAPRHISQSESPAIQEITLPIKLQTTTSFDSTTAMPLPISIQPQIKAVDTPISGQVPIKLPAVSVDMTKLDNSLSQIFNELVQQRTIANKVQDVSPLIRQLELNQLDAAKQFKELSNDLRTLAANANGSIKSGTAYPYLTELAKQQVKQHN